MSDKNANYDHLNSPLAAFFIGALMSLLFMVPIAYITYLMSMLDTFIKNYAVLNMFGIPLMGGFVMILSARETQRAEADKDRVARIQEVMIPNYEFSNYQLSDPQASNTTTMKGLLRRGISLDTHTKKIALWEELPSPETWACVTEFYDVSDLVEVKIDTGYVSGHSQEHTSTLARAAVGGLMFGGSGAIVGALTAKRTQKDYKDLAWVSLDCVIDDPQNPELNFYLFEREKAKEFWENDAIKIEHHSSECLRQACFMGAMIELLAAGVEVPSGLKPETMAGTIRLCNAKAEQAGDDEGPTSDTLSRALEARVSGATA